LLSSPATLAAAIRGSMPAMDPMAMRWPVELDSPTAVIREAFLTFGERLGGLLDSLSMANVMSPLVAVAVPAGGQACPR
jgi:hypothetical protein